MPKPIKIVDYRAVNLAWLIDFKNKVFEKSLGGDVELVVAQEDIGSNGSFEARKGETLCLQERTDSTLVVTKPYGKVRKGEVPTSSVEVKSREAWTTEDVAEYVIKRACLKDECTYLELITPKKCVSKAEYQGAFISQARKCLFADLVGALENYYSLKKVDISTQFVWLDIFCANQPKLTASNVEASVRQENERQLTEGLHIAIANFEERVMFIDKWDGATPLTRAWCVWEIYGIDKANKNLEVALPESEYDRFIVTLKEDFDSIITKTAAVDVETAQCFNKEDLATIHREIKKNSSFAALNDIVKAQLRLWVASAGRIQVAKEELKDKPNAKEILEIANQAGRIYLDQGKLVSAEPLLLKALAVAKELATDEKTDVYLARQLGNLGVLMKQKVAMHMFDSNAPIICNKNELKTFKGRLDDAVLLLSEALAIGKKVHGNEHPDIAGHLSNLAAVLVDQVRWVFLLSPALG